MSESIQTSSGLCLRDILLRRKLNLSKSSWNKFNNDWNDHWPHPKKNRVEVANHNDVATISKFSDLENALISELESQIIDLRVQVVGLSIVNIGLLLFMMRK